MFTEIPDLLLVDNVTLHKPEEVISTLTDIKTLLFEQSIVYSLKVCCRVVFLTHVLNSLLIGILRVTTM